MIYDLITPSVLLEVKAYTATVTRNIFNRQDLYDDTRAALEEMGRVDPERLEEILGDGPYSQSIKDFVEERGLEEKYT